METNLLEIMKSDGNLIGNISVSSVVEEDVCYLRQKYEDIL